VAEPSNAELFTSAQRSIIHLEMRDAYMLDDPSWLHWLKHRHFDIEDRASWYDPYYDRLVAAVERGVPVKRARIVSEPVSDYIRCEYAISAIHTAAGEQVRYLSRRHTTDLRLPGNDFWLFDDTLRITHFSGDGDVVDRETVTDDDLIQFHRAAFEAVWERAIPQQDYTLP
jgi:hypothetical protein